jgi:DNA-binding MarR family transcriptional regulator
LTGSLDITALARLRGVHKAAISRRVARLEAQGPLKSRPGPNGTKLVNVVEFDRAAADNVDSRAQRARLAG